MKNTKHRNHFYVKCNLKLEYSNLSMIKNFQPTPKIEEQRITRITSFVLFHSLFIAQPIENVYQNKCPLGPHIYWIIKILWYIDFPIIILLLIFFILNAIFSRSTIITRISKELYSISSSLDKFVRLFSPLRSLSVMIHILTKGRKLANAHSLWLCMV